MSERKEGLKDFAALPEALDVAQARAVKGVKEARKKREGKKSAVAKRGGKSKKKSMEEDEMASVISASEAETTPQDIEDDGPVAMDGPEYERLKKAAAALDEVESRLIAQKAEDRRHREIADKDIAELNAELEKREEEEAAKPKADIAPVIEVINQEPTSYPDGYVASVEPEAQRNAKDEMIARWETEGNKIFTRPESERGAKRKETNDMPKVEETVPVTPEPETDLRHEFILGKNNSNRGGEQNGWTREIINGQVVETRKLRGGYERKYGPKPQLNTSGSTAEEKVAPADKLKEQQEGDVTVYDLSPEQEIALRQAFNTPGFIEFMALNPDENFDMDDSAKVLAVYEAFKVKEKVTATIKTVTLEHLKGTFDIDTLEALSAVDADMAVRSFKNPASMVEMAKTVAEFTSAPAEIADMEQKLAEAKSALPQGKAVSIEDFKEIKGTLEAARATIGLFGIRKPTWSALFGAGKVAREWAASRSIKLSRKSLEASLTELKKNYDKSEALRKLEVLSTARLQLLEKTKSGLLHNALDLDKVRKELQKKVEAKIKEMTKESAGFSMTESAQDVLEKLMAEKNLAGEEYFKDVSNTQKLIDSAIEEGLFKEVKKVFDLDLKNETSPFTKIERDIKAYLEKNKLGSKKGPEVKAMVRNSLIKLMKKPGTTAAVKVKVKAFLSVNRSII